MTVGHNGINAVHNNRAVWTDGDPLMEAIAAAVWEQCSTEGTTSLVVDDPRNIAAVVAAVVSPPTDRAAELASLAVNAGRALHDEKRHYEIACQENARLRATIDRVRQLHDRLAEETDLASPDDPITRGAAAKRIATALDGWTPPATVVQQPPAAEHTGGNAEDCPACADTNPPYPFICPGPTASKEA